jgi:hypothetical protein
MLALLGDPLLGTVAPTICRYSIKPSYILNQTNFALEIP